MIWRVAALACGVLLLLAAPPAWRHLRETPPPAPPPLRFTLAPPSGAELGAGDDVLDAAIAPDGGAIVFVATTDGVSRLWRRELGSDAADPLVGTEGASMPAWGPTGRLLSFFAGGTLKEIALASGEVRDITDAPAPAGAAWLPDGSLLFVPAARGPVRHWRGGVVTDATTLQPGDRGHGFPWPASGGGFTYVATLADGHRVVRIVDADEERDLTETSAHAYLFDDHLVHLRDGTLMAQRVDLARRTLAGASAPLAYDVGTASTGRGFFAASPRLVVWAAAAPRARELVWFDVEGRRLGTAGEPADYWQVRLSPEEGRAAVTRLDPLLRTLDVFILRLDGTRPPEQLSLALAADSDPVWDPGGGRVVFRSLQGRTPGLFVRRVHAPDAPAEAFFASEADDTPTDWRGATVLAHGPAFALSERRRASPGTVEVVAIDVATGTRTPVIERGFNTFDARWSPDGRRLAYVSDESGRPDIYVEPWPAAPPGLPAAAAEPRRRVSFAGGTRPQWSGDGGSLFFLRDGRLMRADGHPDGTFGAATLALDVREVRDFAVAPRRGRLLAITPVEGAAQPLARIILDWMGLVPEPPVRRNIL
ncbi:MAG: PD40 domain-containing protein [Acidobacteria bacterium]|nr:PD40 domain-containing protein [Acidobacteriota bacterium]